MVAVARIAGGHRDAVLAVSAFSSAPTWTVGAVHGLAAYHGACRRRDLDLDGHRCATLALGPAPEEIATPTPQPLTSGMAGLHAARMRQARVQNPSRDIEETQSHAMNCPLIGNPGPTIAKLHLRIVSQPRQVLTLESIEHSFYKLALAKNSAAAHLTTRNRPLTSSGAEQ